MYKRRYLEEVILEYNRSFKVLYLSGPRQVGKTTLLKHLSRKFDMNYVSLDDLDLRKLAENDPKLFLQKFPAPLFIDEVQYAPQLFPYIKILADKTEKKGRYWLTGSQQFAIMKNLKESLAGRVGILNLLGFSLAEKLGSTRHNDPFSPQRKISSSPFLGINEVFGHILQGSYPALTHEDAPPLEGFYNSYLQAYIDRDLKDIFNISKIPEFHKFLQLCAARTGQMLNLSDLARDADISVHAAKEWINILVANFQIYLLQPYYRNLSKRMIKSPKLYFLDTGLAAHLTKWKTPETLMASSMAGAFLETFAVSEIIKSYWFRGKEAPVYFYRDKEGREVDLILELEGKLYPIEIKLSASVNAADLANIAYLRNKSKEFGPGTIICFSERIIPIDKNNEIIPVSQIS